MSKETKLTKEDIESGSIRLLTRNISDKNVITYSVIYEINKVRYRFEIDERIDDDDQLKNFIYEKLSSKNKIEKELTNNKQTVELITNLLGQNVTAPEIGGGRR